MSHRRNKKSHYHALPVGATVRILRDVTCAPLLWSAEGAYRGDPYVLVKSGTLGKVRTHKVGDCYIVDFPNASGLWFHARSLELVISEDPETQLYVEAES